MHKNFLTLCVLVSLTLGGCQTVTEERETTGPLCPEIPATECPVCEVQECPEPQIVEKLVTVQAPANEVGSEKRGELGILGAVEWALVEPSDLILEARIDTGADTSSIHAEDIQLVEKDGKRYVRFKLEDPATKKRIAVERRLHRRILVKQTVEGAADRRYVVRMWVTLGQTRTWLDVSLSDRDDFEFPLLIGRNMLVDEFAVDVSRHHTQSKKGLLKK